MLPLTVPECLQDVPTWTSSSDDVQQDFFSTAPLKHMRRTLASDINTFEAFSHNLVRAQNVACLYNSNSNRIHISLTKTFISSQLCRAASG
jgi:hypothetical protein